MSAHQPKRGFTLIELLVVIAIIAILAAILFPVFAKAREKARQVKCTSNQRQIAMSVLMYSQENDEKLPPMNSWENVIGTSTAIIKCPDVAAGKNSYVYNAFLSGQSGANFPDASSTVVTADGERVSTPADNQWADGLVAWYSASSGTTISSSNQVLSWAPAFQPYYMAPGDASVMPQNADILYSDKDVQMRHAQSTIVSFLDGHVELRKSLPGSGDVFVPDTSFGNPPTLLTSGANTVNNQKTIFFDGTTAPGDVLKSNTGDGIDFNRDDFSVVLVRQMTGDASAGYMYMSVPGMVIGQEFMQTMTSPTDSGYAIFNNPPALANMTTYSVAGTTVTEWFNDTNTAAPISLIGSTRGSSYIRSTLTGTGPLYLGMDTQNWGASDPSVRSPATLGIAEFLLYKQAMGNGNPVRPLIYAKFHSQDGI